jgi:hypothetical protein
VRATYTIHPYNILWLTQGLLAMVWSGVAHVVLAMSPSWESIAVILIVGGFFAGHNCGNACGWREACGGQRQQGQIP